ncbi:hypothetical protein [Spirosoma areae]
MRETISVGQITGTFFVLAGIFLIGCRGCQQIA